MGVMDQPLRISRPGSIPVEGKIVSQGGVFTVFAICIPLRCRIALTERRDDLRHIDHLRTRGARADIARNSAVTALRR